MVAISQALCFVLGQGSAFTAFGIAEGDAVLGDLMLTVVAFFILVDFSCPWRLYEVLQQARHRRKLRLP